MRELKRESICLNREIPAIALHCTQMTQENFNIFKVETLWLNCAIDILIRFASLSQCKIFYIFTNSKQRFSRFISNTDCVIQWISSALVALLFELGRVYMAPKWIKKVFNFPNSIPFLLWRFSDKLSENLHTMGKHFDHWKVFQSQFHWSLSDAKWKYSCKYICQCKKSIPNSQQQQ